MPNYRVTTIERWLVQVRYLVDASNPEDAQQSVANGVAGSPRVERVISPSTGDSPDIAKVVDVKKEPST